MSNNSIEQTLTEAVQKATSDLYGVSGLPVQIQKTRKDFVGDFTIVVFPFVKAAKKAPEACAEELGSWLKDHVDVITGFNVVKGFLNLELSSSFWLSFFEGILGEDKFGFGAADSESHVMVEFSSPNTNKPLHLGHLRNIFLGSSVARILKAAGHKVTRVQIINDRGIHICKSMVAWLKFGNGETPETAGLKGDKLVGNYYVKFDQKHKKEIKQLMDEGMSEDDAKNQAPIMLEAREMLRRWEEKEPKAYELWQMMNGWVYEGFDVTYKEMGVEFDHLYYESNTYLKGKDEVMSGLEKGIFSQREDGSIWVDLSDKGLDQKLLLRSDGTAVYMTQDIGTAILRFQDYSDLKQQIYTVGNEQEYHFKVLFLILEKLGFAQAKDNFHLSYGMVELPSGKMKSREGTVVDADELMQEMADTAEAVTVELGKLDELDPSEHKAVYKQIGYGALKYFLLKVDPKKSMMFNPEESIDFNGNTGPYIQYNYVRTRSLLRKAATDSYSIDKSIELNESERNLLKKMFQFPGVLQESATTYNPALIANYCYDLVKDFSSFYQQSPVLKENDEALRNLRLALSQKTGDILRNGMELLGIDMPERM